MKKIIMIIAFLLLGLLTAILLLSKSKSIVNEDKYYTIPKIMTYSRDEDIMSFDIYVNNENNIIEFINQNAYYLKNDNNSYKLNPKEVIKNNNSYFNEEQYYKYTINCELLNLSDKNVELNKCYIQIINDSFSLLCYIGTINIYKEVENKLDFSDLYGHYSYINNELYFVGFTIQLDNAYKELTNVEIGSVAGLLNKIEKDVLYDSQRDIDDLKYDPLNDKNNINKYKLSAKQNYYYIPVIYTQPYLYTNGTIILSIDDNKYYIEDFVFIANEILLSDYKNLCSKGEIIYA